jgi:hypothetical protein
MTGGILALQLLLVLSVMIWYGSNILSLVDSHFYSEFRKHLQEQQDRNNKFKVSIDIGEKMDHHHYDDGIWNEQAGNKILVKNEGETSSLSTKDKTNFEQEEEACRLNCNQNDDINDISKK